jgi:glycosyltransferase involved in cell wall biosynthesis
MKILFLQDTDWINRNPHQQVHLAERMVQRGHEVRVIDYEILWRDEKKRELLSKRQVYSASKVFPEVKITVIRPAILKIPVLDYISMVFTYSREIRRQIKEFKPDVILAMDILITFLAYPIAKRNNIPVVYYTIDIDYRLIPQKFLQPLGKWIESWNIRHADLVLSINEGLREYTIRMGAQREKTEVIRAGIDLERYDPSKVSGKDIRKQYGIADDDVVLFFMGWLYHFSGLKEVAQELVKFKEHYPKIKLFIVGTGDAYNDLIRLRNDLHLEDQMVFAGQQPFEKIPGFIAAADICLLPAYDNEIMHDIVPIKMYEYMAMGKPVVSTKLYGVLKEFGENKGIIYANTPEMVIDEAIRMILDGTFLSCGRISRIFVEKLSWDCIVDDFELRLLDSHNIHNKR